MSVEEEEISICDIVRIAGFASKDIPGDFAETLSSEDRQHDFSLLNELMMAGRLYFVKVKGEEFADMVAESTYHTVKLNLDPQVLKLRRQKEEEELRPLRAGLKQTAGHRIKTFSFKPCLNTSPLGL